MAPNLGKEALRQRASWIRDDLDPRIARDGPDCMHPDDVLTLHELFLTLKDADPPISVLRYSRIHTAVTEVCGKATRWPKRLAEECDKITEVWEKRYGRLSEIRPRLFKPDGRLYGICTGKELTRDALLKLWSGQDPTILSPNRGMQHGCMAFRPGDWWINGIFAFHAGIIDLNSTDGGICANKMGAYAVVMTGSDEICTESPDKFTYRCSSTDPGRFRMTSADFHSRYPIRVLRSHTLTSLWAPKSGIRYDGLHKITGWAIRPMNGAEKNGKNLLWEVEFERDYIQEDDSSQHSALKFPLAEQTDDYMEYKRIRKEVRDKVRDEIMSVIPPTPPVSSAARPARAPIQSPPMSPKSEPPSFFGEHGLREPIIPGSPETPPPLMRTKPPAHPQSRIHTGPIGRPDHESLFQSSRSLTVPQTIRKSLSTIGAEFKGKVVDSAMSRKPGSPSAVPDNDRKAPRDTERKESKSIAKSITRIFADGARDTDLPESPFGSHFECDDELSSFPFNAPARNMPTSDTQYIINADGSKTPILRQPQWGTREKASKRDDSDGTDDTEKKEKPRSVQRRDRAVYEAFSRQESSEPRLLMAALNEVWDVCAEPEYPDMVLEEPVHESASTATRSSTVVRSDDYLERIPPGGIDVQKFIAQQQQGDDEGDGDGKTIHGVRQGSESSIMTTLSAAGKRYSSGSSTRSAAEYAHEIGNVLREMEALGAGTVSGSGSGSFSSESLKRPHQYQHPQPSQQQYHHHQQQQQQQQQQQHRLSNASDRSTRRSSVSSFDARMPAVEDGARFNRARRPTIVRFSGMFKRQSLDETVDEEAMEAAADEKVVRKKPDEGIGGLGEKDLVFEGL